MSSSLYLCLFFFFFNDTATTEIYTLSLHDALPISECRWLPGLARASAPRTAPSALRDRKSTRLNSSHSQISYAVFCLKTKKNKGIGLFPTFDHATTNNIRTNRKKQ